MPDEVGWARAFAMQGLSYLRVREKLIGLGVERCHVLHFIQMAAEKICKAHLSAENGIRDVKRPHAYIRQVLPVVACTSCSRSDSGTAVPQWQLDQVAA